MKIQPFKLERYFAKYEFSAPYLLSCSDCEPLTQKELLEFADDESKELFSNLWLGYTESQGHPKLREEITKLYQNIQKDNVVVLTPEEGIFIALNVLLTQGDHVVVTYPGYQSLYEIAISIGCDVSKWLPREAENMSFNVEDLIGLIKPNTKLIVINFPHNPTGFLPSIEDYKIIIEIAKEKGIYVLSDEMYRFLEYNENDRLPSASDLYDKAISLFGVSKSFALAGLRIGWLTTQNSSLMKEILDFKDYTTICSSAPSEILALIALKAKEKIFSRNLEIINDNLIALDQFFQNFRSTFQWVRPKAGTIAFPKLVNGMKAVDFSQELLKSEGVMLLPSEVYDYEGENIRFGFGRKNMKEVLSMLEKFISE
ncbi:aminotransferase class I/II-fold pyridoxal phosphate-dependent enzyme [Candidatus Dojkabacteria bacterium]|nr:aminotransferase class I/II-fold pyridoxal phosphate-dependent enzyme [Candidatus Dojkabacteria bacterium]